MCGPPSYFLSMSAIRSKEPHLSVQSIYDRQNHKRGNQQHNRRFCRAGVIQSLHLIVDVDGERARDARNVATHHEYHAKLTYRMGEAQHQPCYETSPGLRHDNTKERLEV